MSHCVSFFHSLSRADYNNIRCTVTCFAFPLRLRIQCVRRRLSLGHSKMSFYFFALVPFYFVCVREMWTGEKWARSDKRVDSAGRGVKSLSLAPRTHIQQRERERLWQSLAMQCHLKADNRKRRGEEIVCRGSKGGQAHTLHTDTAYNTHTDVWEKRK
jgi:hypothetical protein